MKFILLTIFILYSLLISCYTQSQALNYFGQTPPDKMPALFAPGIISLPNISEIRVAFSPDGNECFFTKSSPNNTSPWYLYQTKCENNVWTTPALAPFQKIQGVFTGQAFFSNDGNKLYYSSDAEGITQIWVVQNTQEGWGIPTLLDSPINVNNGNTVYFSETLDSVAYFASNRPGGAGNLDIWRTRKVKGQPLEVENLGPLFNTSDYDYDPYIEPHGRYLLFARGGSVYLSFSDGKDGWKIPINMDTIIPGFNAGYSDGPSLSPDGKYIFWRSYFSGQPDIYWVSAGYIDSSEKMNFPPYVKNPIPDQVTKVDSLFCYKVPDSTFFDDDGNNTLTYTSRLSNGNLLPLWLSFDSETKTFSGTPDSAGTFKIKVFAIDTAKANVSTQFTLTINDNQSSLNQTGIKKTVLCPNPTNGLVNIFLGENQHLKIIVEVYNTEGMMLLTDTSQDTVKVVIDLTGYSKGMYIFRIIADDAIFNERICLK